MTRPLATDSDFHTFFVLDDAHSSDRNFYIKLSVFKYNIEKKTQEESTIVFSVIWICIKYV